MSNDDSIDTLLDELSSYSYPAVKPAQRSTRNKELTEEDITNFVIKSSSELINAGLESVADLRDYITQGQNPDEIEALAGLITSTTNAIESLNKMVLLKKKNDAVKELKLLEFENRKEVASLLPQNNVVNNTNVLVASRAEIFEKLLSKDVSKQAENDQELVIINKDE